MDLRTETTQYLKGMCFTGKARAARSAAHSYAGRSSSARAVDANGWPSNRRIVGRRTGARPPQSRLLRHSARATLELVAAPWMQCDMDPLKQPLIFFAGKSYEGHRCFSVLFLSVDDPL